MSNKERDECAELQNIKYKTMLMNGTTIKDTQMSNDLHNLDMFLESEKNMNRNEPWSKLDKTNRTRKIVEFVETYANEHDLSNEEKTIMITFLKDCLNKKKLYRVKDVTYDKESGVIKDIPALVYNKHHKHFTLKKLEKHTGTVKSLPHGKVAVSSQRQGKKIRIDTTSSVESVDSVNESV